MIVVRTIASFNFTVLRSREMSKTVAGFEVLNTYLAMGLAVLGATTVIGGLTGYYIGLAIGEGLVLLLVSVIVLRWTRFRRVNFSRELTTQVRPETG